MKPTPFELYPVGTLAGLGAHLAGGDAMRVIAGGQSLGPMLNLRLARPGKLVGIGRLPALVGYARSAAGLTIGACVTHAEIADGRVPAADYPMLPVIAAGIAYPAVRTRGTIGGSLAHADPAADWVVTLTALDATVLTWAPDRPGRAIPMRRFMLAAYATALEADEIVQAVRIPPLPADARWGYFKACRKPGEFAHAMAAILESRACGIQRLVIGATGGAPIVLEDDAALPANAAAALAGGDPMADTLRLGAINRAWAALR